MLSVAEHVESSSNWCVSSAQTSFSLTYESWDIDAKLVLSNLPLEMLVLVLGELQWSMSFTNRLWHSHGAHNVSSKVVFTSFQMKQKGEPLFAPPDLRGPLRIPGDLKCLIEHLSKCLHLLHPPRFCSMNVLRLSRIGVLLSCPSRVRNLGREKRIGFPPEAEWLVQPIWFSICTSWRGIYLCAENWLPHLP